MPSSDDANACYVAHPTEEIEGSTKVDSSPISMAAKGKTNNLLPSTCQSSIAAIVTPFKQVGNHQHNVNTSVY